jgi:hypothetical protein
MRPRRTALLIALMSMTPAAMVVAQTTPPTQDTSPSSASSPHQRDATHSNSQEATTGDGTSPSAASSPHQQQATGGSTRTASKQSMKDCIAKQQQENSGMSKEDARKACKTQMKPNSG